MADNKERWEAFDYDRGYYTVTAYPFYVKPRTVGKQIRVIADELSKEDAEEIAALHNAAIGGK